MVPTHASLLNPPLGFAHRGARAHARENTLDAFRLARRLGATGLESDAWLTLDAEVVLDHDGVTGSWPRRRPLSRVGRSELPPHVPSLAELYEACGTDLPLSLDVKDPEAARIVVATARDAGGEALANLWLCSPSVELLASWRGLDDDVHLMQSTRLRAIAEGPERRAARLADLGIDGINMPHQDWNGGLTTLFHRFERVAFAWDVQHEHQLHATLRMGVDAVYSDHVDRMAAAVTAFGANRRRDE
ncbi:MAG: glycerophosphodiester phosphodiesterase [Acidimicrobiales bacterium]